MQRGSIMKAIGALLVVTLLAAACGGGEAEPTPTPTALAALPPPESFGAAPAPEGVQIIPRTTEFPEPAGEGAPTDYSVVGPGYAAAHDPILARGREFAALLAAGDLAAVRERFHRTLRGGMTEDSIQERLNAITTNRVSFEARALGAMFDGHVDGETISGGYVDNTLTASFMLEADELSGTGPLEGRWTGSISLGENQTLAIEVVFESDGDELAGTLAFPSRDRTAFR